MNITDDIARAGRDAITGQHIGEYDYLVAITLDEAEELARYIIEAVAPLIAAKAWDEGYQACRNRPSIDGYRINRVNPYQTRADRIERGES